MAMPLTACSEATLGGKGVEDYFKDRDTRALARAAAEGDVDKISQLVQLGADVNAEGEAGIRPLYWAIVGQNKAGFKRLLELGADPNLPVEGKGNELIPALAAAEDPEYLEIALAHGADTEVRNKRGYWPLYAAAREGRWPQLKMLVERCANLHASNEFGETTPAAATDGNHFDMVEYLLDEGYQYDLTGLARIVAIPQLDKNTVFYELQQALMGRLRNMGIPDSAFESSTPRKRPHPSPPQYGRSCKR